MIKRYLIGTMLIGTAGIVFVWAANTYGIRAAVIGAITLTVPAVYGLVKRMAK